MKNDSNDSNDLGTHIAITVVNARNEVGFTQAELARRMGTTQSAVARLESGQGGLPTLRTLMRAAEAMGGKIRFELEHR